MRPVASPSFAHAPPAGFVRVGLSADLPQLEGRTVTVAGRRIAVFRTEHGLRAIDAECPHMGGPLGDGLVAGSCVTCPLHGLRIDLESGTAVAGGNGRVAVHEALELDGELWLRPAVEPVLVRAA
jgi:nitrite reductase (NADH) small subunit